MQPWMIQNLVPASRLLREVAAYAKTHATEDTIREVLDVSSCIRDELTERAAL